MDRYTFAPLSQRPHRRFSGTLCSRCLYIVDLRGVALREVQRLLVEARIPVLSAYFAERGIFKTFVSGFGSLATTQASERSITEARRNLREVMEEIGLLQPTAGGTT